MKKILIVFAVLALAVSFNSCSNEDENVSKSVTFKVDGVDKNFKVESAETGGLLFVTGYIGNPSEPTEYVTFTLNSEDTGANAITNFSYENLTSSYDPISFSSNVTENSGGKAEGTFFGTLEPFDAGANIEITEGSFSIK